MPETTPARSTQGPPGGHDIYEVYSSKGEVIAGSTTDLGNRTFTKTARGCYRLSIAVSAKVSIYKRFDGTNLLLRADMTDPDLVADGDYALFIQVPTGQSFSIRFEGACTVRYCVLEFVPGNIL